MFKEVLKAIIVEGQELLREIVAVKRNFVFEEVARYVFVGVRQSGKSYLMYLRAQAMIAAGHSIEQMLFVNFDDERLIGFQASDFDLILQAYSSLYQSRPILFLDEIQNVEGWEHFSRRLANLRYHVYITGSNAKMLSSEVASKLGGRYIEQFVFPYSFTEYLVAHDFSLDDGWEYGKRRAEVERLLKEYFEWGGFPELLLYVNKRRWLNELYEKILLGDIIARNRIRNVRGLRFTLSRLVSNLRQPTSYNRLANLVNSAGAATNVASVAEYIGFCRDACILFEIENYGSKFAERATVKKHYFVDNGLLAIFLTDSDTSLLENLIAVTLYRRWKAEDGEKVWFYNKEVELDFYLAESRRGIQASYSLRTPETEEREVRALEAFHRLYGLNEAEIVTWDEEREIKRGELRIKVIPLLKWLLRNH